MQEKFNKEQEENQEISQSKEYDDEYYYKKTQLIIACGKRYRWNRGRYCKKKNITVAVAAAIPRNGQIQQSPEEQCRKYRECH